MTLAKIATLSGLVMLLLAASPVSGFQCTVNVTGLSFGNYDVFSPVPAHATATLSVSCNIPSQHPDAPLDVSVSLSPGGSGTFSPRHLLRSGGADRLNYNLYTNPSFSTIWGDGSGSSVEITRQVTRDTPLRETIYGEIPARQNVSAGLYSDVVTVTVIW